MQTGKLTPGFRTVDGKGGKIVPLVAAGDLEGVREVLRDA